LRYAYFITCREVVKNAAGDVTELLHLRSGNQGRQRGDGRKVQATLHWVAAKTLYRRTCGCTTAVHAPRQARREI
jgi:hypothetical protein